ncbi:MAG TPA: hypothetical protein VMF69_00100 [Gemmataceae bacterium]|nr:hypothetical protein [Gemmataceae bacterium]
MSIIFVWGGDRNRADKTDIGAKCGEEDWTPKFFQVLTLCANNREICANAKAREVSRTQVL